MTIKNENFKNDDDLPQFDEYKIFNLDEKELERLSEYLVEHYFNKVNSIITSIKVDLEYLLLLKELSLLLYQSIRDLGYDGDSYRLKLLHFFKNGYLLDYYRDVCDRSGLDVSDFSRLKVISDERLSLNNFNFLKRCILNYGLENTAKYLVHNEIERFISNLNKYTNISVVVEKYFEFFDFITSLVYILIKILNIYGKKGLSNSEARNYISFLNQKHLIEDEILLKINRYGFQEIYINQNYSKLEDLKEKLKSPKSIEFTVLFNYPKKIYEKPTAIKEIDVINSPDKHSNKHSDKHSNDSTNLLKMVNSFIERTVSVVIKGIDVSFKIENETSFYTYIDVFKESESIKIVNFF